MDVYRVGSEADRHVSALMAFTVKAVVEVAAD
jgi:hypothetical protein